jgi:trehalose-phosphatase
MSQPLFENLTEISNRLRTASHVFLFLDFDGTLTPIVERPEMARLSPEIKDMLIRLSRRDNLTVAVISGRALDDIQALVGVDHLIYAGNHGMQINGQGLRFVEPTAISKQTTLQRLSEDLATRLRHLGGVEVENKGLTTSIHFRRAAAIAWDEIAQIVKTVVSAESHIFLLTTGKMVYEIRPRVNWNKGSAIRWIRGQLVKGNALSICLGDDVTDEDAFAAIPESITIKVGDPETTAARYYIASPREVQEFLVWLEKTGSIIT